ncbi:MAG: 30S ribosomal protein S16 [Candidatus Staskawiczbacteria bacterium]|nr:30S ribosomal protein S16 [Candidatus Staskawiczbacteria bacterium]
MLTIRLTRKGKKNQPFFRVVVVDKKRSSKGGRAVEILGYVDPLTKKKSFKKDRVLHWIKMGAQPSPTMHNLLVSEKIIEDKKIAKFKKTKKAKTAELAKKAEEVRAQVAESAPVETPAVAEEPKVETPSSDAKAMEDKEEKPVEAPKE